MDWLVLLILGLSGLLIGAVLGEDDGDGASEPPDDTPPEIGRSDLGAGGYGPDGEHDLVWGTSGADTLAGTDPHDEVISAYGGDDVIGAGSGNDRIFAHAGNDTVNPGAGDDDVFGGDGRDLVDGGFVAGTFGDTGAFMEGLQDRIDAGGGFFLTDGEAALARDLGLADVEGDFNDDFIRGEDGNDVLADTLGSNVFHGDLGADLIFALDAADPVASPDRVFGGFGADTIFADSGDRVSGGGGVDRFVIANGYNSTDVDDETAVAISDFDPASESIEIENLDGELGGGTHALDEQPEGTYITLDGHRVVLLEGLAAADLGGLDLTVTDRSTV